jgi:hypothetical protein
MSALFRWTMRHGAKIVFAIALLQLLAGLVLPLYAIYAETSRMAANHEYTPEGNWASISALLQMSQLFYSLTTFAFLLIGAIAIDRADAFLALRRPEGDE